MAQAVTSFEAFGIEIDEPLTKRFRQVVKLNTTGLNTDTVYDIGTNAGTFWTAAGGSVPGAAALAALKNIQTIVSTFLSVQGPQLQARGQTQTSTLALAGAVGSGSATPAVVVTGLLSAANGDTILSVVQNVKGANSLPLLGFNTQAADALVAVYSADPGAGATLIVTVRRGSAATVAPLPVAGQYTEAVVNQRPNLVFASGDAPTAMTLWMEWDLQDGQIPIKTSA
jgi:hypothetical protein